MAQDARFEDIPFNDQPLRLRAVSGDDLAVISALVQDAVGRVGDTAWMPGRRRFAMVVNRLRWEDCEAARRAGRPYERVRTALVIDNVTGARARGLDPADCEVVVSLLSLAFEPGEDCAGRLVFTVAGDGELALDVECLEVSLTDLTRPWVAHSHELPEHEA